MRPPALTTHVRKATVDHAGNGRPALRLDVTPILIGVALAEIAEIAGDVRPVLRWDATPMLIGVSPAETAETPANQVIRKRFISPRRSASCF